ncbi:hypothetical protein V8E36_009745 [Tilletia maclaganii]
MESILWSARTMRVLSSLSILSLALGLFASAHSHERAKFARRQPNSDAFNHAVREMAQEQMESYLKRGTVSTTCRTLEVKDIISSLTLSQVTQLVDYTNKEILNNLRPGMTMFGAFPDAFSDPADPTSFTRSVSIWRSKQDLWLLGISGAISGDEDKISWWFDTLSDREVADFGLARGQICLDAALSSLTVVDPSKCTLASFDAHGTMAAGGSVQVSIQQATTLTTEVTTEQTSTAGESLSTTFSGGIQIGGLSAGVERTQEAHWEVSNSAGKTVTTSTSVTNTVQITFEQKPDQSCYVELSTETCQTALRLVTPVVLKGLLHLLSAPDCRYNLNENGDCKNNLFVDIGEAMKTYSNKDSTIIQFVDASLLSTGTYKQRCINNSNNTTTTPDGSTTNVTTNVPDPPSSTLTVYGHTATSYALTATVAEKTATRQVITEFFQPTVTIYAKTKDVATATVYSKTVTLIAPNAKTVTTTSTRRPRASTVYRTTTSFRTTSTTTFTPTTTSVRRVTRTLTPTTCRRALGGDEEGEAEQFVRSEPTAAPVVIKRDGAAVAAQYAATTSLPDATTTITEPIKPTTVTATGSTTTITSAVQGTQKLAAITTTDSVNTQYRFVTSTTGVSTAVATKVTSTRTITGAARTSTLFNTVTRASTTKTVNASTTVTVRKTVTATVTPPSCTR